MSFLAACVQMRSGIDRRANVAAASRLIEEAIRAHEVDLGVVGGHGLAPGEECLAAGLADELAEAEGFEETCLTRLEEFAEKDALALGITKGYLRAEALATMRAREMDLTGDFLDGWFSTGTRERIRATVEALKAKG